MAEVIIYNIIKEENITKQWAPLDKAIFAKYNKQLLALTTQTQTAASLLI